MQAEPTLGRQTPPPNMNFFHVPDFPPKDFPALTNLLSDKEFADTAFGLGCLIVAQRLPHHLNEHQQQAKAQGVLRKLAQHGCNSPITQLDDGRICRDAAGEWLWKCCNEYSKQASCAEAEAYLLLPMPTGSSFEAQVQRTTTIKGVTFEGERGSCMC